MRAHALAQINRTVAAEIGAGCAGDSVERDNARIHRRGDNPLGTLSGIAFRRFMIADAATGAGILMRCRCGYIGRMPPDFLAGRIVNRDHHIQRGADIEHAVDVERRCLEVFFDTRAKAPDFLQSANGVRVDVLQLGKAGAARRVAIVAPVGGRLSTGNFTDRTGPVLRISLGARHQQYRHNRDAWCRDPIFG